MNDKGRTPFVTNIEKETLSNDNYRAVRWTGNHLQLAFMSISVGSDIGLEIHEETDQFIRIESGEGIAILLPRGHTDTLVIPVEENDVVLVPAGTWHNIINKGDAEMKIYTLYGPPHHPVGEVDETKPEEHESEED